MNEGQDRKNYSDDQDRKHYTVAEHTPVPRPPETRPLHEGKSSRMKDGLDVQEASAFLLKQARETGAGFTTLAAYNADHEPLWCIVVVTNKEQAIDVMAAMEGIE